MTIPDEEAVKLPAIVKLVEPIVPQQVVDAFENRYGRLFDLSRDDHEWRNTNRYKHAHIQSMWEGWRDGYLSALSPTTPGTQAPGSGETVPAGWRLVPVEPTEAMIDAARYFLEPSTERIGRAAYRAMLASAPSASIGAMGAGPLGPQTNAERICFGRGMQQWRASLNRPDLSEEDRVKGALEAYCRMAFALSITIPGETQAGDNEEMKK